MKQYKYIAVAGTWDHFHAGHKQIIDTAFQTSNHVMVGITADLFAISKPTSSTIESFSDRKNSVHTYLDSKKWTQKAIFFELSDIFGPSITDSRLKALVVTRKTLSNAHKINIQRIKNGFKKLDIVIVDLVMAMDNKPIASKRIRMGEIDRGGRVYSQLFSQKLILPEKVRALLQEPLGKIHSNIKSLKINKGEMLITVGDMITATCLRKGIFPSVQIIDRKIQRETVSEQFDIPKQQNALSSQNDAGTISVHAASICIRAINKYKKTANAQQVIIDGEEDLLALVAIVCAPLQAQVLYGDYKRGIVEVCVSEKAKQQAVLLLERFDKEK